MSEQNTERREKVKRETEVTVSMSICVWVCGREEENNGTTTPNKPKSNKGIDCIRVLQAVHTFRLESWGSDKLLFLLNGIWQCGPALPAEHQRLIWRLPAAQGKPERGSASCKCPLTQCEQQQGERQSS